MIGCLTLIPEHGRVYFWTCSKLGDSIALVIHLVFEIYDCYYRLNRNSLGKPCDVRDGLALHGLTSQAGFSTGRQNFAVQGTEGIHVYGFLAD